MQLRQYQVDAFSDQVFGGNPAAVVPLSTWPDDAVLQAIAAENNLSETAFFSPSQKGVRLRWFTPVREVDLCGHATLASAHVIFQELASSAAEVLFETHSGELFVKKRGAWLEMDFPASHAVLCPVPEILLRGLARPPVEVLAAEDYLVVVDDESDVLSYVPEHNLLAQLDLRGVIVTAPGRDVDFVSRFFAPKFGIPEDPVTGSAHCALAPYWANRTGRDRLAARQLSRRGGYIDCEVRGKRVLLSGQAVTFMIADIFF
ncbi:PhzF family phenazine biosynthesis protein [Mariprofundus erugo]|uniref:PhzF family phenazine biosynthesis protein n=1 Tax=Mariprofundus erugo TaxID=2528639 RepID=A0A5R9GN68_9PROT|nr:PhzF family phenazine biosynthesis protein [Mariprofundus erugo]TLS65717.1 PhzF family phenazine biosynthesis protein [Mariprofundus erugo]